MFRLFTSLVAAFLFTLTAWAGVNVNTASQSELTGLPGIGPAKAAAIVQYRTQHGPFKTLNDLDSVSGIGPATLSNITPLVIFSGDKAGAPATAAISAAAPVAKMAAASTGSININTVDASGLQGLPGIGPSKAEAIFSDRTANGPFASCSDLQRVRGVGPATVAGIVTLCTTK